MTRVLLLMLGVLVVVMTIIIMSTPCRAESERQACDRLAAKYQAQTEVALPDRTRVDLLNDRYAIEVDFARKWAEAVGQSLHYADATGKEPAIILLVRNPSREQRYLRILEPLCQKHGITLFVEPAANDAQRARVRRE